MMRKESSAGTIPATWQQELIHKSSNLLDPVENIKNVLCTLRDTTSNVVVSYQALCLPNTSTTLKIALIDNSVGEVKCLTDIPLLDLGNKVAAYYCSFWIIKIAHL